MFECTDLTYTVDGKDKITTSLTLSPPPSAGGGEGFGLSGINFNTGGARRSQANVTMATDQYPGSWLPPDLSIMPFMTAAESLEQLEKETAENTSPPPLTLPQWFGEKV
jgi:hypothetical protein